MALVADQFTLAFDGDEDAGLADHAHQPAAALERKRNRRVALEVLDRPAPGLTLIKVHADRLHYWDGGEEGEVRL